MARGNTHPYIPSAGILVQTISQLRKMFPSKVDSETLKRLSLAPKNESVVINVLRFLDFIDEEGNKTTTATQVFQKHSEDAFSSALEKVVKDKYSELFSTMGEEAWETDRDSLIGFFRVHDETSALTAKRQAITFEALSALAGHGEVPTARVASNNSGSKKAAKKKTSRSKGTQDAPTAGASGDSPLNDKRKNDVGLTVRIEVNLPAQGDQETYDRIFASLKKNLLDG